MNSLFWMILLSIAGRSFAMVLPVPSLSSSSSQLPTNDIFLQALYRDGTPRCPDILQQAGPASVAYTACAHLLSRSGAQVMELAAEHCSSDLFLAVYQCPDLRVQVQGAELLSRLLSTAIKSDCLALVKTTLSLLGWDANGVPKYRPLIMAIRSQRQTIASHLIHMGADVNLADIDATVPLAAAVQVENVALVTLLLQAGADMMQEKNMQEWRNIIFAHANTNTLPLVYVLMENIRQRFPKAMAHTILAMALTDAVALNKEKLVYMLLQGGADVHFGTEKSLRIAVAMGHDTICRMLLEAGANVHVGGDALMVLAAAGKHDSTMKILQSFGAKSSILVDSLLKGSLGDAGDPSSISSPTLLPKISFMDSIRMPPPPPRILVQPPKQQHGAQQRPIATTNTVQIPPRFQSAGSNVDLTKQSSSLQLNPRSPDSWQSAAETIMLTDNELMDLLESIPEV
jgi:hypothetical protein